MVVPYIYSSSPWVIFLLYFCHRRRLAPPLAAAAVEPPPATQITLACSPRPRTSVGPPELVRFRLNRRTTVPVTNSGDQAASRGRLSPPLLRASRVLRCNRCELPMLLVLPF
jgi:hypothetical protein